MSVTHRACSGFGWDNDGDVLSVISDKSSVIFLWDANNWRLNQLESGFRFLPICYLFVLLLFLFVIYFHCCHSFKQFGVTVLLGR